MKKNLFILFFAFISLNAYADFLRELNTKFPQTKGAIVAKAFGDFYSVVRGNEVVYVNKDLSIMINGDVIDLKANKSISGELRQVHRPKIKPSELELQDAIKFGSGSEKIFVFSDPDCPYCRQLEAELEKLPGVTIYLFPYPIAGLHPNAISTSESIWCSKDQSLSWRQYVLKGVQPSPTNCKNPIQRNIAFAEKNHIQGTPALIFEDGSVIPGSVPLAALQKKLISLSKK